MRTALGICVAAALVAACGAAPAQGGVKLVHYDVRSRFVVHHRLPQTASALGIRVHHWAGGHDGAYWHRHYARYLRFYAAALAAC